MINTDFNRVLPLGVKVFFVVALLEWVVIIWLISCC